MTFHETQSRHLIATLEPKMTSLKQIKRNFLIRLMTVLGFGGMAAFCVASCQPEKVDQDKGTQDKPSETVDQEKADQDKQPEPETVNQDGQQKDEAVPEVPEQETNISKDAGDEANKDLADTPVPDSGTKSEENQNSEVADAQDEQKKDDKVDVKKDESTGKIHKKVSKYGPPPNNPKPKYGPPKKYGPLVDRHIDI